MAAKSTRFLDFKVYCLRSGRTLRDVAGALGVSASRLSVILHGDRVTPEMAKRLLDAGVPMDYLPPVKEARKPGPRRKEGPLLQKCVMQA